jgi:hypothetical protein
MKYDTLLDLIEQAADAGEPLHLTPAQVETTYEALCKLEELQETLSAMKVMG